MEELINKIKTYKWPQKTEEAPVLRTEKPTIRKIITRNILTEALSKEAGDEILEYISDKFSLKNHDKILFISKNEELYNQVDFDNIRAIINLQKINTHSDINQLFKSINNLLPDGGFYIGCVETYGIRKEKIIKKYGKALSKIIWVVDSIIHRVLPRIKWTRGIYYFFNKGNQNTISLAEALGRLAYCGFDIIETKKIKDLYYFEVLKIGKPKLDKTVSSGFIFPMKRVGKGGKIIKVYKIRTMHPYSEFIQDYVLKLYGYNDLGKPNQDFRLARWGKFLRKYWLDEILQILNILRGNMVIVGVRPLSKVRFNQFPADIKEERVKYKPGCIPPYVALRMPDANGNIEAERIYLNDLKKHPYTTNIKYLYKALYNIITNKIRSS